MQKADDAVQPRAQLNTLPDELKAYIARLCAEQDVAVRKALVDCHERFQEFHPPASDVDAYLSQVKCSVGALYGTSKGWQKVAAPYRFQVCLECLFRLRANSPLRSCSLRTDSARCTSTAPDIQTATR